MSSLQHLARSHIRNGNHAKVRPNPLAPFYYWSTSNLITSRLLSPVGSKIREEWHATQLPNESVMDEQAQLDNETVMDEQAPTTSDSPEIENDDADNATEKQMLPCGEEEKLLFTKMEDKCKQLELEVETLQRSIEELKCEMCDVRDQLRSAQTRIDSYIDTIKSMEAASTKQCEESEQKTIALTKAKSTIEELQQQVESEQLEQRLFQARLAAVTMERDNHFYQLQKAVEKSEKDEQELRSKFDKDLEGLRKCNTEREQVLMDDCEWKLREIEKNYKCKLDKERKLHQELLSTTRQELEQQHNCERQKFQTEKELLITNFNDIETQLTDQIHSSEAELSQLQGLTHELQRGSQTAQSQIEQLQETESELRDELVRVNSHLEDNRQLISKLKNEICQIKEHHEKVLVRTELQTFRKTAQAKAESEEMCMEKLRKQASILHEELLKEYENEKQLALEMLQSKKNLEFNQLMQEFQNKQDDYKNHLHHLEIVNQELKNKCKNLQDSLQQAEMENQTLTEKLKISLDQFRHQNLELLTKCSEAKANENNALIEKAGISHLSKLQDLQVRHGDLIARQIAIDIKYSSSESEVNPEMKSNTSYKCKSEASEQKIEVLQELNQVQETVLRTVCFEVKKSQEVAQQREDELKKHVVELEEELKIMRSQVSLLTQTLSQPEKILFQIETSSTAKCSCLMRIVLIPVFVLFCSTAIAFAVTFLLLSFLLPALLPYLPL